MSIRNDLKALYDSHMESEVERLKDHQAAEKVRHAAHDEKNAALPDDARKPFEPIKFAKVEFDIDAYWINGNQTIIRIESFPEDSYGFIARFQNPSATTGDYGRFSNYVYTVNPDHIRAFRKL